MRYLLFVTVVGWVLFAMAGCRRTGTDPEKLTGKLVVVGPCNQNIVQVLSGNIDSSLLTKSWKDSANGNTYVNVFFVTDHCEFDKANLKEGDVFTFNFGRPKPVIDCFPFQCMLFYPVPPAQNSVINVQKIQ